MFHARTPRQTVLIALLFAAAVPYFLNLGVSSIWDANEAFYAETPREMMEAGDYVTPSFNFQVRLNKPVLSYWQVAFFYHVLGISEQSERLPIAVGGIAIIAVAFALGRLLGGTTSGLFAALVLATSPRLLLLARRIIIDIHITMFTGLVLLCFALSEARPQRRRLYLCLMYVAAGLGVLTKGPVAVFIPAVVFFIYLASQRRLGDLRQMMLPTGAAIGLAIVVPWYYFVYRAHGWEYIGSFIFGENLGRYAQPFGDQSRGLLFYLPVMLADLFPWSPLIPLALWWAIRDPTVRLSAFAKATAGHPNGHSTAQSPRGEGPDAAAAFGSHARLPRVGPALGTPAVRPSLSLRPGKPDTTRARVTRLLVIWIATFVMFFSLSGTKEDLYILPIVTAEAALIGAMLARAVEVSPISRPVGWFTGATALVLIVTGGLILWVFEMAERYALDGATLVAATAIAGGMAALVTSVRRNVFTAVAIVAGTLIVIAWCVVLCVLPDFERYKPVRPFTSMIRARASVGAIVGSYKFALPSMVYYLHRPIMEVVLPDHLRAVFYSSSDIYFVMPEIEYEKIKERLPVKTYVLARQPMFDLKARNFLDGSELPQFVLVSNRLGDTSAQ